MYTLAECNMQPRKPMNGFEKDSVTFSFCDIDTNATTTPTGAEQDIQPTPATQPDTSDEEDVNNSLPTPMTPQSLPPTSIQGQIDSDELLTDDEAS